MRPHGLRALLHLGNRIVPAGRELASLVALPPRVRRFYVRALLTALRTRDRWSLVSATRPRELRVLVELAQGATRVVEVGTGTAWTAIALGLADEQRHVITYDPHDHPRERYLGLVGRHVRDRIELRAQPAEAARPQPSTVELLFIDGDHRREPTLAAFRTWEPSVTPGGTVVFHDYGERHPGVEEAVASLSLEGEVSGVLFLWRKPLAEPGTCAPETEPARAGDEAPSA